MSARLLLRGRSDAFQWHRQQGMDGVVIARSAGETWLQRDGTLRHETRDRHGTAPALPPAFLCERRHWRHFLARHPLEDLQLRCVRRHQCVMSPTPRWGAGEWEWTLHATLTIEDFGLTILSTACRAPLPPGRYWRHWLAELCDAPHLEPVSHLDKAIVFRGDMLLAFLAPALDHVIQLSGPLGVWQGSTNLCRLEDGDEDWPDKAISSYGRHQSSRFVPAIRQPIPADAWRAIHYDADRNLLLCRRTQPGPGSYRLLELEEPLYRYFPKLSFGGRSRGVLLKEQAYLMPAAVLDPG